MKGFNFLPFELALVLGVTHRDILDLVEKKELEINGSERVFTIPIESVISHVSNNIESYPQLYKVSLTSELTAWRTYILKEVEQKWPSEQSKLQSV